VPALIERLGGTTIPLDCEPNGRFTRELEPLPEHLGALGERVRASGADFGVAVDPDADRARSSTSAASRSARSTPWRSARSRCWRRRPVRW
jgi:hypothetical protein